MNKNRIAAMVAAAGLAGCAQVFAAQDNTDITSGNSTLDQKISEQKPLVEASTAVATTPTETFVPPAERLLSEMKVYPAF